MEETKRCESRELIAIKLKFSEKDWGQQRPTEMPLQCVTVFRLTIATAYLANLFFYCSTRIQLVTVRQQLKQPADIHKHTQRSKCGYSSHKLTRRRGLAS